MNSAVQPSHSFTARALLRLVAGYRSISASTAPRCRYLPTCSEFAGTAIERHGARRGAWMATKRLCRCHPFAAHGHDPVPPAAVSPSSPHSSSLHSSSPQQQSSPVPSPLSS